MDLVTEELMMSKENDGPAFPIVHPDGAGVQYYGMTLRDYFAAKAMQGFCADPARRIVYCRKAIETWMEGKP